MKSWLKDNEKGLLALAASVLFLIMVLGLNPASAPDESARKKIIDLNTEYLDHIEKESRQEMIKLSEIAAFLDVIESGQVGISFIADVQVTIGKALSKISSMIEKSIQAMLVSAISTELLKLITWLADHLSGIVLKIFSIIFFVWCVLRLLPDYFIHARHIGRWLTETFLMVFLALYLVIPYSVHVTSIISTDFVEALKGEHSENLDNLHSSIDTVSSDASIKTRAEHAIKEFEEAVLDVSAKIDNLAKFFIARLAIAVVETLILPIGLMWFLIYLTMAGLRLARQSWQDLQDENASKQEL